MTPEPVNVADYERLAADRLAEGPLGYYAGGAGDERTLRANAAAPVAARWFQVYVFKDRGVTRAMVDEAIDCGYSALALTVDAPRAGRRERDFRTGFSVPPHIDMPAVTAAVGHSEGVTPQEVF